MPSTAAELIAVVIGIVRDADGRVLIAQRPAGRHLGGLWEFPGGKIESGESVQQALARELHEEIGIDVQRCAPLCEIVQDYGDRAVHLSVREVSAFSGEAVGREGQPLLWVEAGRLSDWPMPAANADIIKILQR
jgi:8-oxo-dGTP diphosphatase